jgi:hypothetical protein
MRSIVLISLLGGFLGGNAGSITFVDRRYSVPKCWEQRRLV